MNMTQPTTVLVTGATGYIGCRLVPLLLEKGYQVRAVSRSLKKLQSRPWANHPNIQLHEMDALCIDSVNKAIQGCDVAFYLIHSMLPEHKNFSQTDKEAAQHFVRACDQHAIKQMVYMGGLGDRADQLSPHLRSRAEVGDILRSGRTPVTTFRAAMVIGSGSASFEILRYLVDRLPVMLTPKWVHTPTQPIAVRNVLHYLTEAINNPKVLNQTFDIGGKDIVTYKDIILLYAKAAGLGKKWIIPVPVFSPRLSSYWIHLVTPVHASIAQPLAEGLKNPTVCQNNTIQSFIPQTLMSCDEAIKRALERTLHHDVSSHWTDAGKLPPPEYVYPGDPEWSGGTLYKDVRSITLSGTPEQLWQPIVKIGGENGWYYGDVLWQLRGIMDLLFGGIGLRGGRRHPTELFAGDALDFWRVIDVDDGKRLKLMAEMKVPGEAYLEFTIATPQANTVTLIQSAWFVPRGLVGILYWYAVTPLHHFVFNGMLQGIASASNLPSHHPIRVHH